MFLQTLRWIDLPQRFFCLYKLAKRCLYFRSSTVLFGFRSSTVLFGFKSSAVLFRLIMLEIRF